MHPPRGEEEVGYMWHMKRAMYGTRRASHLFQEHMKGVLKEAGHAALKVCHQVYHCLETDSMAAIHGDDIIAEGESEKVDRLNEVLKRWVVVKVLGRIGPGAAEHGQHLKRHMVHIDGQGFEWLEDPKHLAAITINRSKMGAKPQSSPGSKCRRAACSKNTTDSCVGDKIAYMVCEHFRATGAYEAVQGLSDFFTIGLQNDDVQDFDVLWDEALLSASEMPSDVILEGMYKSKLQDSVQLQTVLALYDHETARHNGKPNYQQLTTAVKLHIDQMMRTRNFRVRNEVVKRGSVTKSQKGKKSPR